MNAIFEMPNPIQKTFQRKTAGRSHQLNLLTEKRDALTHLWTVRFLASSAAIVAAMMSGAPALAEGTAQIGATQRLYEYGFTSPVLSATNRPLLVDIVTPGEVINVSVCGTSLTDDLQIQIFDPVGTQVVNTTILNGTFGDANCLYTFSAASNLPNPLKYTTTTTGAYEIRLTNLRTTSAVNTDDSSVFRLFDVTVAPNAATAVTGTETKGRLYAKSWAYRATTNDFTEPGSADTNYFVKVPGGRTGENFVWTLDLNNFAGLTYEIIANAIGVNAPNSGFSTPFTGNSITPLYPVYLSYPQVVDPPPLTPPALTNLRFIDSAGVDNTISPGTTGTIQDTGTFEFTTDVAGTYSIIIDTNNDGIYSLGDVFLFGPTTAGANSVVWDGKDNNGVILPLGSYNVRVQVRVGEYHFVAGDAETSGGTQPGLTIFRALSQTLTSDVLVFWDDITKIGAAAGGTTTYPNGALSSTPAARHTWGTFTATSFGDQRYIDTYVYGNVSQAQTKVIIANNDTPSNVLLVKRITAINGISLTDNVDDTGTTNDNHPNWPSGTGTGGISTFLAGATQKPIKPGDVVDYTIYYLVEGNAPVTNVKWCDRIPIGTTYVPGSMVRFTSGTTTPLTDTNSDGDNSEFLAIGNNAAVPCPSTNTNGTALVNLAPSPSQLPSATGPGTPNNAYGYIRFRATVN
jgi:uncharacterized repeat protein (TIGR01451 family)